MAKWILPVVVFLFVFVSTAVAQSVPILIESGLEQGQGLLFRSDTNTCYGITVAHAVGDSSKIAISDNSGNRSIASIVSMDNKKDIALFKFNEVYPNNNNIMWNSKKSEKRCNSEFRQNDMLHNERAARLLIGRRFFGTRTVARAGGFELVRLTLIRVEKERLVFTIKDVDVIQSDSGMAIWSLKKGVNAKSYEHLLKNSKLVGFTLGVSAEGVEAIPAYIVSSYIYNTLNPIEIEKMIVEDQRNLISHIKLGSNAWGFMHPSKKPRKKEARFHINDKMNSFSIQYDLGGRDQIFDGLTFNFPGRHASNFNIYLSQNRPRDSTKWEMIKCQRTDKSFHTKKWYNCLTSEKRIVRGIWIDVNGPPKTVTNLKIKLKEL